MLYADDGFIRSQDPDWLQGDLNVLISLFCRFRLMANIEKYRTMPFQLGAIHTEMSEKDVNRRSTGNVATYRQHLQRRITCPECGVELTAGSMMAYVWRLHGTYPNIDWGHLPSSQIEHLPHGYEENPAWAKGLIRCFDMSFMIKSPVQICAFICLMKLQKGVYLHVWTTRGNGFTCYQVMVNYQGVCS